MKLPNKKIRVARAKKGNIAMREKYGEEWVRNNCIKAALARWAKK